MITYNQQLDFAKVFGETLFYGANCVLMIAVVHIQLTSRHLHLGSRMLLCVADVMFLLSSSHMALLLYECLTGQVPPRILQAAVAIAQFQLFLGESILIWRVWVVWNRDLRVVIFPSLIVIAGLVLGMLSAVEAVCYNALSKILPIPTTILAVVNTTVCTTLITARLAYIDRLVNGYLAFRSGKVNAYRGLILLLVESGAVLTIGNIVCLVLERLQHPGLHVMLNISTPLANAVPTTIIVLSHFRLVPGDTVNTRLTETFTVRFGTQFDDSACLGSRRDGTADQGASMLQSSPDVEKQSQCFGAQ